MNYWKSKSIQIYNSENICDLSNYINTNDLEISSLDKSNFEKNYDLKNITKLNLDSVIDFLYNNYFCFYSKSFFEWYILNPFTPSNFNIIIKVGNKIIGVIVATVRTIKLYNTIYDCPIINFLCVAKEYRKSYIAGFLIDKVSEAIKSKNILIAIFSCRYPLQVNGINIHYFDKKTHYYKILNSKKCINNGFINLSPSLSKRSFITKNKIKKENSKNVMEYTSDTSYNDEIMLFKMVEYESSNSDISFFYKSIEEFRYWNRCREFLYTYYNKHNLISFKIREFNKQYNKRNNY